MGIKTGTKLQRYPWDKWLSGEVGSTVKLRRGKHYHCQTQTMTIQIRAAAAKRGVSVSLHVEEVKPLHGSDWVVGEFISTIKITITGKSKNRRKVKETTVGGK